MKYEAEIETRVAGIPCFIRVITYESVAGTCYTESEWEVLDRRGRKAPWLERKLTDKMRDEIEETINEYFN